MEASSEAGLPELDSVDVAERYLTYPGTFQIITLSSSGPHRWKWTRFAEPRFRRRKRVFPGIGCLQKGLAVYPFFHAILVIASIQEKTSATAAIVSLPKRLLSMPHRWLISFSPISPFSQ